MSEVVCPECGNRFAPTQEPLPEPPLGTWVRDRHGGVSVRIIDSYKNDGWAPAPHGFYAGGKWDAMWQARGPLVECPPWGVEED